MTLTTHAIVGAASAQLFPAHPALAFSAGFVSHLAIDSLPHWDYEILSLKHDERDPLSDDMVLGKKFLFDLVRIGSDALLGLVFSLLIFFYFFHTSTVTLILIGAAGGIFPDFLQFVYWKTRSKILTPLQRFHIWIQEGKSLHIHPLAGLSLQFAMVIVLVLTSLFLSA